jgi:integrase
MPKLSPAAIEKYKPGARRREIRDSLAPGLYLIVQPKPKGSKSWALRFRRPDKRPAKLTLGTVDLGSEAKDAPVLGGALTLRQARELANQIDRQRAQGLDVVEEHQARRRRQQDAATTRAANSFGSCAREFFADYKTKHKARPRRWHEDAALLGLRYPPGTDPAIIEPQVIKGGLADTWRDKPVADIDGHNIHSAIDTARKQGADSRARKLHVALSSLFRWLVQQRRVTSNPAHGVWRPGPPAHRERVLTDAEIVTFWRACDRLGPPYNALFKLLLLTGCRLREVAKMTRGELVDGVWTIPGQRTKNHRTLSLPLPPLALEIIAGVPVIAGEVGFVFTSNGLRPIGNFARAKALLDAAMAEIAGQPVPFRLHDLRRTFVSGLAALGVQLPVIERCVNHISGSFGGIVGVYQKHEYTAEKAEALARWAKHISGLVADRANIVDLKKPARRRGKP